MTNKKVPPRGPVRFKLILVIMVILSVGLTVAWILGPEDESPEEPEEPNGKRGTYHWTGEVWVELFCYYPPCNGTLKVDTLIGASDVVYDSRIIPLDMDTKRGLYIDEYEWNTSYVVSEHGIYGGMYGKMRYRYVNAEGGLMDDVVIWVQEGRQTVKLVMG